MVRNLAIAAMIVCAGCAAVIDNPDTPIKPGMAQIVITHTGNMVLFVGGAVVEINGVKVASLGAQDSYVGDIATGPTTIATYSNLTSGRSTLHFDAEAGKSYRLSVAPRGDTIAKPSEQYRQMETAGAYQFGRGN